MERIRRRADFLAAARGRKAVTPHFLIQQRSRGDLAPARVGFTVSRKVGNAVERNRVRRRLREIVRTATGAAMQAGYDYVVVGRRAALGAEFETMIADMRASLARLNRSASVDKVGGAQQRGGGRAGSDVSAET